MADIPDGGSVEVQGSAAKPYILTNTGGVYACTCPAWRNQSLPIEKRTCKHLRKLRGDEVEKERVGGELRATRSPAGGKDKAAPPILLAHAWDNAADVTDWWMSEKLDGVRAYWDGAKFLSRPGNEYMAPDWFVENLPDTPLDGELWIDRKMFQKTVGIVRRQDRGEQWKTVRFLIFDAPEATGGFEERLEFLADAFGDQHPYAQVLQHQRCKSVTHMREELERVEKLGGEGLMLREPGSTYAVGRSMTLLKVKTFHDSEATVIDYQAGKGRHKGRLGALLVKLPDGTEFSVGTGFTDAEREAPPAIGSTITFRYQELTDGGVPRFPSFVRFGATAPELATSLPDQPAGPRAGKPSHIAAESTTNRSARKQNAPQVEAEKPAKASSEPSGAGSLSDARYFELEDDKSRKFWEIRRDGLVVHVRYGRIGADGTRKAKEFADDAAAQAHVEKLIGQKTKKGYDEISG